MYFGVLLSILFVKRNKVYNVLQVLFLLKSRVFTISIVSNNLLLGFLFI